MLRKLGVAAFSTVLALSLFACDDNEKASGGGTPSGWFTQETGGNNAGQIIEVEPPICVWKGVPSNSSYERTDDSRARVLDLDSGKVRSVPQPEYDTSYPGADLIYPCPVAIGDSFDGPALMRAGQDILIGKAPIDGAPSQEQCKGIAIRKDGARGKMLVYTEEEAMYGQVAFCFISSEKTFFWLKIESAEKVLVDRGDAGSWAELKFKLRIVRL